MKLNGNFSKISQKKISNGLKTTTKQISFTDDLWYFSRKQTSFERNCPLFKQKILHLRKPLTDFQEATDTG